MANTTIDIAAGTAIDDISSSTAGTLTNDVAVVIKAGTTKEEAFIALTNIMAALLTDRVTIAAS